MIIRRKFRTALSSLQKLGLINFIKFLTSKILHKEFDLDLLKEKADIKSFYNHSMKLDKAYGKPDFFTIGKISNSLLEELKELIIISGNDNVENYKTNLTVFNNLIIGSYSQTKELEMLKEVLIGHPFHLMDPLDGPISKLHQELRIIFADNIKSPFAFINTRAWTTKPNTSAFGPNSFHTDGFKPGHMKIMVYITPLNEDYGEFALENKKITNHPEGTCVCFANSDIIHAGVPGKKFNRISIEVTLMRAFFDSPQTHKGHYYGRHLTSPEVVFK